MLVTDMPIWEDCPFRNKFPPRIEIRRGLNDGVDFIAFWDPVLEQHVDIPASSFESASAKDQHKQMQAIKRNMRFFREHPELLKA